MDQRFLTASQRYPKSRTKLKEALRDTVKSALAPPTTLSVSEWADEFAYLSAETSADAGKFKCFGYQRGMLDAISDPSVKQVTVVKSARIGYTKCLDHVVGYFVHQDPSPILVVQPRVEDAEDYSRTEIAPMLRDTPCLAEIVGDLKAKDSNQRVAKRMFPNGSSISFVGANSPGGFRRITARVVLFDEVDGYPVGGAGDEGDQIALGIKRSETFWNRKIVLGSTPTIKHISRIERSFEESDQRRYHVPCPHCGEKQVLKWSNLAWDKERDDDGNVLHHDYESAYFVCEHNGCIIEEHNKPWMVDNGEWIADKPFEGHAGFHIWAAYSLFPNARWAELAREFIRCHKDPKLLQTFVNLILGETWEELGERVDANSLISRCNENYDRDTIPQDVRVLTAGVDVQDNRLELLVVGWGAREESWVIAHETILGDPAQPTVWNDLDQLLLGKFHTEDDRVLRLRAIAIDSGGHHTETVYKFARDRHKRNVYAIKGNGGAGKPAWPKRASKGKGNHTFYNIGVDGAKDSIYGRLRIEQPGPGYMHFTAHACDEAFFKQLTSEFVQTRYKDGRPYRVWVLPGGKRNEALDLMVYAYAALQSTTLRLDRMASPVKPVNRDGSPAPNAIIPPELVPMVKDITMKPPANVSNRSPRQPARRTNPLTGGKKWF